MIQSYFHIWVDNPEVISDFLGAVQIVGYIIFLFPLVLQLEARTCFKYGKTEWLVAVCNSMKEMFLLIYLW